MNIVIVGCGVQGTLIGLRLARAGHSVTLVARGNRGADLRTRGAALRNAITGQSDALYLPVVERLAADTRADLCFVLVRREQLEGLLSDLRPASAIARFVIMVNHANGSESIFAALGRKRVVLGFPSAAGAIEDGIDVYVDVKEQPMTIEYMAPDIAGILRRAGFRVRLVADVDSWLKRHAVFVTAVAAALYQKDCNAKRMSADKELVRTFILAVREGWSTLDALNLAPAPFALRVIFSWVPLPLAVIYWRRLFGSTLGEYYFARHSRHAIKEMAALAADVRALVLDDDTPHLRLLYETIDQRSAKADCTGLPQVKGFCLN